MSVMSKIEPAWSVPVAVDDIADTGLRMDIEAPAEARADIAKLAALRELPMLAASFELTREGARVHVSGQVKATVGQTCVVTLEPIENQVEESVDLVFAPPGTPPGKSEDASEPLAGDAVDLGAVATEFLLLGVDPYPRKAGANFVAPAADTDGPHPFAALEALKKRSRNKQP
jgi:uncharacterized metal-binding protein YceD (DUF177 family)